MAAPTPCPGCVSLAKDLICCRVSQWHVRRLLIRLRSAEELRGHLGTGFQCSGDEGYAAVSMYLLNTLNGDNLDRLVRDDIQALPLIDFTYRPCKLYTWSRSTVQHFAQLAERSQRLRGPNLNVR